MFRRSFVASLLPALLATGAIAGEVMVYGEADRVDPREVARILGAGAANASPDPAGLQEEARPLLRSIRLLAGASPGAGEARPQPTRQAEATPPPGPTALALPVRFAFDSADIDPRARSQLDALAEGIRLLAPDRRVVIEGHTDASGSDQYNLLLSQRRALAVKRYLVVVHGIGEQRLEAVGMGEFRPLDAADPGAPRNRRVEFRGG